MKLNKLTFAIALIKMQENKEEFLKYLSKKDELTEEDLTYMKTLVSSETQDQVAEDVFMLSKAYGALYESNKLKKNSSQ